MSFRCSAQRSPKKKPVQPLGEIFTHPYKFFENKTETKSLERNYKNKQEKQKTVSNIRSPIPQVRMFYIGK